MKTSQCCRNRSTPGWLANRIWSDAGLPRL